MIALILAFAPDAQAQPGTLPPGYTPGWIDASTGNYKEVVLAVQYGECPTTALEPGITCRMDNWTTQTAIWTIPAPIVRRLATTNTRVELGTAYLGFRWEGVYSSSPPTQTGLVLYFNAQVSNASGNSRWLSELTTDTNGVQRCSTMYAPLNILRWQPGVGDVCVTDCSALAPYVSRKNLGDYAAIFLGGVRYVDWSVNSYYREPEYPVSTMGYAGSPPERTRITLLGRTFDLYSCALRLGATADRPVNEVDAVYGQHGYYTLFPPWMFAADLYNWIDRPRGWTISDLCPSRDPYGGTDILRHAEDGCRR